VHLDGGQNGTANPLLDGNEGTKERKVIKLFGKRVSVSDYRTTVPSLQRVVVEKKSVRVLKPDSR